MCAYQRPVIAPLKPLPWPCGECGSPSWSVCAWCLRWSATHDMTGPWTDIEPNAANVYSTDLCVWNERCVSRRWKPSVTPKPVIAYMMARAASALQSTQLVPAASTIATDQADHRQDDAGQVRVAMGRAHLSSSAWTSGAAAGTGVAGGVVALMVP